MTLWYNKLSKKEQQQIDKLIELQTWLSDNADMWYTEYVSSFKDKNEVDLWDKYLWSNQPKWIKDMGLEASKCIVENIDVQNKCKEVNNKMANISEFTKALGEFLKADIVVEGTVAVIVGEAAVVHNEKFDTDRLHIPIEIEEKGYTFDCSKTNARLIEGVLGEDTFTWVGSQIVLETYKTKTSDGKMVKAINVKEVKPNPNFKPGIPIQKI